jgi:hypothetical protein
MWLVAASIISSVILIAAVWRIALDRHKKRQNRSMRDHLNRISSTPE